MVGLSLILVHLLQTLVIRDELPGELCKRLLCNSYLRCFSMVLSRSQVITLYLC